MQRLIRLLGPPGIEWDGVEVPGPRGMKAWGVLAVVALSGGPVSRRSIIDLLFDDADDPMGALRWNLSQLRTSLGDRTALTGDPLTIPAGEAARIDVQAVLGARAGGEVDLDLVRGELLEGLDFSRSPAFDAWLQLQRHHVRAAASDLLTEGAVERLVDGDGWGAAALAVRALDADSFDPERHALLVQALVRAGDVDGARSHVARCVTLFRDELGAALPPEIASAFDQAMRRRSPSRVSPSTEIRAAIETGAAALAAGAVSYALLELERAGELAADAEHRLRAEVMLAIGSARVHQAGDRGLAAQHQLQDAHAAALRAEDQQLAAEAAAELGFLHVQLGRRERAARWLAEAERLADGSAGTARVLGIRAMEASDRGDRATAIELGWRSVELARSAGAARQEAWSLSMVGRALALDGAPTEARLVLDRASDLVARERWSAFAPWVLAWRNELLIQEGDIHEAADGSERAYALSRSLGDHCWIAMNARGMARARFAGGDLAGALDWAADSVERTPWYLWVHAYALTTAVRIAEALGDRRAARWRKHLVETVGRAQLGSLGSDAQSLLG